MKILYIFLLAVFSVGCNSGNSKTEQLKDVESEFKKAISEISPKESSISPIYMVIPRAGCSGCISDAELYMTNYLNKNPKNGKITFILTEFDDEKIIRARFDTLLSRKEVLVDRGDKIGANNLLKSIYPSLYFFDKTGQLRDVGAFSPSTDGQGSIEKYLQN
ncbi:MAG TPA: hypothetical protein VKB19_00190 [Pedobacter sp.]|nr:hypothetical protein [Pedobacter sp.]